MTRKTSVRKPAEGGVYASARQFLAARLTLLREARGWTRRDLAARINTTASAVSQFESGTIKPSADMVRRLAFGFGVAPSFFTVATASHIDQDKCHFRRRRTATQIERRGVLARGELRLDIADYLAHHVDFPVEDLQKIPQRRRRDTTAGGIETLAASVRELWGLGQGPIANAVQLLELHGLLLLEVPGHSERLDAFSTWVGSWPIVFIATDKNSATRRRFDVIHELGHLLMHSHAKPGDSEHERQADAFASAFLLPRFPFGEECPRRLVWPHLLELKQRWKVSLAALVRRAYDLGIFSEATYRRAFVQLSKHGWRRNEPGEPELERPVLLQQALTLLASSGFSLNRLATDLGRNPVELEQIVAGAQPGELGLFG